MLQSYKYGLLSTVRNRSLMFWTLAFPIILGTFFNIAFGSIIKNTETFSQIPVAVITDEKNTGAENFLQMIENLSQGENALIAPQYFSSADIKQAEQLLSDKDIDGIFQSDDSGGINLTVLNQGLNQSVLKSISDSYIQISQTVNSIAKTRPDMIEQTVKNLSDKVSVSKEIYLGRGETDTMIQYFYALLAMACLYGSLLGYTKVSEIQADKTPLAARRCVSPSKKIAMILSDFSAAATVQFVEELIIIAYLVFVLGVNFGGQWGFVILTCLLGSIMGVSYGIFIGSFVNGSENKASAVISASILSLCFLSGLMLQNMKNIIEQYAPIINRINPAAVLSDAFYCLTVYDNYSRYTVCIITMVIISFIFCAASAFVLRRKKYASI